MFHHTSPTYSHCYFYSYLSVNKQENPYFEYIYTIYLQRILFKTQDKFIQETNSLCSTLGFTEKPLLPLVLGRERGKLVLTFIIVHVAMHRQDMHLLLHKPNLDTMLELCITYSRMIFVHYAYRITSNISKMQQVPPLYRVPCMPTCYHPLTPPACHKNALCMLWTLDSTSRRALKS